MAWDSLAYYESLDDKQHEFDMASGVLRASKSLDDLFESGRMYWFFQRRSSFLQQNSFMKWDPDRLEEYILLPVEAGFVNNRDCFFVSHYWRTQEHLDPNGEDYLLVHGDLNKQEWSYLWLDWTCMPQLPRSATQETYFRRMLARIPALIRDSAYTWRFPDFQPRLWVLYEVAESVLGSPLLWDDPTPDVAPFVADVLAMTKVGVTQIIQQRGYCCTNDGDEELVIGCLEILVIFSRISLLPVDRKRILDSLMTPTFGDTSYWSGMGVIKVDKHAGIISHNGTKYRFTPIFKLARAAAGQNRSTSSAGPGDALELDNLAD